MSSLSSGALRRAFSSTERRSRPSQGPAQQPVLRVERRETVPDAAEDDRIYGGGAKAGAFHQPADDRDHGGENLVRVLLGPI
jgi:hypothetical protein